MGAAAKKRRALRGAGAIVGLGALLVACRDVPVPRTRGADGGTDVPRRLGSCDALRETYARGWADQIARARTGEGFVFDVGMPGLGAEKGDSGAAPTAEAPASGRAWSETNVQVEGVDEPDVVETDGTYLYTLSNAGVLDILEVWPAEEARYLRSVDLRSTPRGMMLAGDTLVVLGEAYAPWVGGGPGDARDAGPSTRVDLLDVGDPNLPRAGARVDVEGALLDARRVGDQAWVAVQWRRDLPSGLWEEAEQGAGLMFLPGERPEDARERIRLAAMPAARRAAARLSDAELLPRLRVEPGRSAARHQAALACEDVYSTGTPGQGGLLAVLRLDLAGGELSGLSAAAVTADAQALWMNAETLLIAEGVELATSLGPMTRVHAFSLGSGGRGDVLRALGSAELPGIVADRWSLDVYAGHVRVATTELPGGWRRVDGTRTPEPANNVFVLRMDAHALTPVGVLRGLTPGEQIMAARFMGERAYLVTFRQTDPLLSLDLSVPEQPRLAGELKVPGFSTYLHPYGEDQLLAVGMDGTPEGTVTGFAVALYDVADPARPERLDLLRYTTGWSASPALWDPHALLQVEDVLALPVYDWDPRWRSGVSGLSVVQITGDRLMELGRIDHGPMARERCASGGSGEREPAPGELVDLDEGRVAGAPDAACASSWPEMRRAVAIEQVLFAVSDAGVSAHPLHSPEVILAEVPAPPRARDVTGKPLPEDDLAPRQEQGRPDAAR